MAKFVIQNRIENPSEIRAFNLENYVYRYELSTAEKPTFTRKIALNKS